MVEVTGRVIAFEPHAFLHQVFVKYLFELIMYELTDSGATEYDHCFDVQEIQGICHNQYGPVLLIKLESPC